MRAMLRRTGVATLYSFYRHLAFNMPRLTTGSGVILLLGVGAIHLYLAVTAPSAPINIPAYLVAYFALVFAGSMVAAAGMLLGRKPVVVKTAWALGSLVAAAGVAMYLVSRTIGLPGATVFVGWWDYPLGTFAMMLALLYVGLHLSAVTGVNVALHWRSWNE